ncbi:MAG: hypothetical protein HYU37_04570 [Acidobacteria bacterium]|nr:hypothetical protein [Acidobacteriota bacterium]
MRRSPATITACAVGQELPTEEADAIDLVRMDEDGWQLSAAPSIPSQIE